MFTFVIVIYNAESTILYLLESIKYQIKHYGEEKSIQLILADDASSDRTCEVVDRWLADNDGLFCEVVKLYSDENRGTCKNVGAAIRSVKGEAFFIVDGDDILSKNNIFAKYKMLDRYDIIANAALLLKEDRIIRTRKQYLDILAQSIYQDKFLKSAVKHACPVLNGSIVKKELFTENVLKRMEEFTLLDDRSRYYEMFKENQHIRYCYEPVPILIYRTGTASVSSYQSPYKKILNYDLKRLYRIAQAEEPVVWERISLKLQEVSIGCRRRKGIIKIIGYMTPYYMRLSAHLLFHIRGILKQYQLLAGYMDENEAYVEELVKRVNENGNDKRNCTML